MKIWHISDTHSYHGLLQVPEGIDMVIHSGDMGNSKTGPISNNECRDAIEWLASLDIPHKVLIAGNHDVAFERGMIRKEDMPGITYLQHEEVEVAGLKIFGSPYTPTFGEGWAFNKRRDKLSQYWAEIQEGTDVVISHGPPKGILDHSYNQTGNVYERCGCNALAKKMREIQPKLCLFGHIHNCEDIINAGYTKLSDYKTIYSNGSVVTDGKFGKLTSNGNIFEI